MATVYQFETWDHFHGEIRLSDRWGTREAIAEVKGRIVGEGVEIDDSALLGGDVDGMTVRGFDPYGRREPHRFG